jgi:hypothetical protein
MILTENQPLLISRCGVCGDLYFTRSKDSYLCGDSRCLCTYRRVRNRNNPLSRDEQVFRYFYHYFRYEKTRNEIPYYQSKKSNRLPQPPRNQCKPPAEKKKPPAEKKIQKVAWKKPTLPPAAPVGWYFDLYSECYLKEAHAMLSGKDTAGKNKCVKLPGDPDNTTIDPI